MATKYQVTELDKALQQFKGIDEWTNEKQLRHRLQIKEKTIDKLNEEIEELKQAIHLYHDELTNYRKLKSELFPLIERLWAIDSGDPLQIIKGEKKEIINTIAYRIANEWID